ncbi:MAG: hypothetical protein LBI42_06605 [Chitinispirillales bacterium]|jgi:hypothetical protein|nr:hypothetical protein [Chitinispirillales bacterium]
MTIKALDNTTKILPHLYFIPALISKITENNLHALKKSFKRDLLKGDTFCKNTDMVDPLEKVLMLSPWESGSDGTGKYTSVQYTRFQADRLCHNKKVN